MPDFEDSGDSVEGLLRNAQREAGKGVMRMTPNPFPAHILLVEPQREAQEQTRARYEGLLQRGQLARVLQDAALVTLHILDSTDDVHSLVARNYLAQPNALQLLHLPEQLSGERGSELMDELRWKFAGKRLGAILYGGYSASSVEEEYRRKGAFRYLPKLYDDQDLLSTLQQLSGTIFAREPPSRRIVAESVAYSVVSTVEDFEACLRLRYEVWSTMSYIPVELRMDPSRLEADKFDACSLHLMAKAESDGQVIGTARVVTRDVQPHSAAWLQEVLSRAQEHRVLSRLKPPQPARLPTEEVYDLDSYLQERRSSRSDICEHSRQIMHPGKRGMGISRGLVELGLVVARLNGYRYVVASCVPQHAPMNARYGYNVINLDPDKVRTAEGRVKDSTLVLFESVGQVANIIVADLRELPEPTRSNVQRQCES